VSVVLFFYLEFQSAMLMYFKSSCRKVLCSCIYNNYLETAAIIFLSVDPL
jgi:phosphate starvation-inducible membrane PsiE